MLQKREDQTRQEIRRRAKPSKRQVVRVPEHNKMRCCKSRVAASLAAAAAGRLASRVARATLATVIDSTLDWFVVQFAQLNLSQLPSYPSCLSRIHILFGRRPATRQFSSSWQRVFRNSTLGNTKWKKREFLRCEFNNFLNFNILYIIFFSVHYSITFFLIWNIVVETEE